MHTQTLQRIALITRYFFTFVFLTPVLQAQAANQNDLPPLIVIPAGSFISGSNAQEREYAYRLDEAAYGSSVTRKQGWYDAELPRTSTYTDAYCITTTPVTNHQYAVFIQESGRVGPDVDRMTWDAYGLIHSFDSTRRFAWTNSVMPAGRGEHPVVLVTLEDAKAYAAWLTRRTGLVWRLPTELEWEKAMRGKQGRYFPWGNVFDPQKLNSADKGSFDTTAVGQYPQGASPYGLLDGAGQVYEWTATPRGAKRSIVKGGSWDDKGCGVCRAAARHSRPNNLKHILIGFRLVREVGAGKGNESCQSP
ncbi:SUMF1/EgtB/PvdO family nonheme iron enzyme [Methylotenera sp.]|uniref:formylglycine-generating enzyme family protein n=1 Tax=Methylotenera sp. TaxID=2051956 RepID=UPI0027336AF2|nr:SUMF1/EgtB/PvdO family nonheme iron enzyme [Methylotenera sp.]MDP3004681.1 SUMF1/EgtB/PvdO family nonheme iron enzyme [Methylotenera sp.]